jgi:penicillin-binding protein A
MNKKKIIPAVLVLSLGTVLSGKHLYEKYRAEKSREVRVNVEKEVSERFTNYLNKESEFKKQFNLKEKQTVNISLSINEKLQKYIEKISKRHKSDYSAIAILNIKDGSILGLYGQERKKNKKNLSLALASTHPSASLFKIITSIDLLENAGVENHTVFNFRGRGTTLYKYQLLNKVNRWTRFLTFEKAFAFSNNVIFGKAAIRNSSATSLYETANKLGFNKKIVKDITVDPSTFKMPDSQYNLAELASGFNKDTVISPIHAATIAAAVANKGVLFRPHIIKRYNIEGDQSWEASHKNEKAFSIDTAEKLQKMMEMTVKKGTARSVWRKMKPSLRKKLTIGGKTGSITGGVPYGKRDWLTAYAVDELTKDGIAIAVMNVNVKRWYVKSTFLTRKIIEYYFKLKEAKKKSLSKTKKKPTPKRPGQSKKA